MLNGSSLLCESAQAAGEILAAVKRGDLADLEFGLERAERVASRAEERCPHAVDQLERLELLRAVATQMRRSVARFRRWPAPHLEGIEVHLRLLRHLADPP